LFGNRGVPELLRHVNGYGIHTFNIGKTEDSSFRYVKIHFKPDDGNVTMKAEDTVRLAGEEPDYHIKDVFNAIEKGEYPIWTMCLQIMDPKEAETYRWNIFDATRIWPHKDYPLIPVGKLTLKTNPENYFQDIEQAAFSPSNMVPGISTSADLMLQARMFSYPDAALYRVGANYQQLPCNRANHVNLPYQRDGFMKLDSNYGAGPEYARSSFRRIAPAPASWADVAHGKWVGEVGQYTSEVTDEDFEQPCDLWKLYKKWGDDQVFIANLAAHLKKALPQVQEETISKMLRWIRKLTC
jgi:catalase